MQNMEHIFALLGLGSATSAGYEVKAEGSGRIFAYGLNGVPTADITNWNGEKQQVSPATKQAVADAFTAMSITETSWEL